MAKNDLTNVLKDFTDFVKSTYEENQDAIKRLKELDVQKEIYEVEQEKSHAESKKMICDCDRRIKVELERIIDEIQKADITSKEYSNLLDIYRKAKECITNRYY